MTDNKQYKETGFELSNGTKFTIYHNLPDTQGLDIMSAFTNWLARTGNFTAKSFVQYILSKQAGFEAYTKSQWNKKHDKLGIRNEDIKREKIN